MQSGLHQKFKVNVAICCQKLEETEEKKHVIMSIKCYYLWNSLRKIVIIVLLFGLVQPGSVAQIDISFNRRLLVVEIGYFPWFIDWRCMLRLKIFRIKKYSSSVASRCLVVLLAFAGSEHLFAFSGCHRSASCCHFADIQFVQVVDDFIYVDVVE